MARRRPLQSVTDLLQETLLHLVEFDRNWVSWEAWLAALGVTAPPRGPSLEFDNYLVLTQAVLDGQGIALGGGRLAEDFLARGVLIRPIEATLRSDQSFYLLVPADQPLTPQAKAFRDWILVEAKERTA
jgi:LysR family glycine cleavage system transcriptional activator